MLIENRTALPPERQDTADEGVDFRRVLDNVIANRWLVILCVVLATAACAAVAFLTRPVYRATAVLTSTAADRVEGVSSLATSALGGLASNLGIGGTHDADTEEALAVLRSRELTETFITNKKLMPELFARKWNAATGRWNTDHPPTLA